MDEPRSVVCDEWAKPPSSTSTLSSSSTEPVATAAEHEISRATELAAEDHVVNIDLPAAKQGLKRRWSFEENSIFKRAFEDAVLHKEMPSGVELATVSEEMKNSRTVAQIRTRLNNIILGKQKLLF